MNTKEQDVKSMKMLDWLYLILTMNIPVAGWIVVIIGAIGKNKPTEKKMFCRAYIVFKAIMLVLSLICIYFAINVSANLVEQALDMMQ